MRLILASASPRRRELLAAAGHDFVVRPADIEEPPPEGFPSPQSYVCHTAWLKAAAVHARTAERDRIVLAADTVAFHDGAVIGKPKDRTDALRILRALQGTDHLVLTGLVLWPVWSGTALIEAVTTTVRMTPLSDKRLQDYLDTGLWRGKAGAYGIQDRDDPFVASLAGSRSNVMGLPLERLAEMLPVAERLPTEPASAP